MRTTTAMRTPTRRTLLAATAAVAGTGMLSACSGSGSGHPGHGGTASGSGTAPKGYVDPAGQEVAAAEKKRGSGPVRKVKLTAAATSLDLGGRTVKSWTYGGDLPGEAVRVTAGDTLALTLANHLPEATSLHWHGIALRNDMDGVPGLTQRAVKPGADFTYRFTVPHAGTYWFHPHSGTQQDRGLYAPLIVEDPKEPLSYDKEWVVVLDDWVDGVDGSTPDAVLKELSGGMGMDMSMDMGHSGHDMSNMSMRAGESPSSSPSSSSPSSSGPSRMLMGAESDLLGGDAGDVAYPYYLVNGRTAKAPSVFRARPGDRVRIRIINAGVTPPSAWPSAATR